MHSLQFSIKSFPTGSTSVSEWGKNQELIYVGVNFSIMALFVLINKSSFKKRFKKKSSLNLLSKSSDIIRY